MQLELCGTSPSIWSTTWFGRFVHPPLPDPNGHIRLLKVSFDKRSPSILPRLCGRFKVVKLENLTTVFKAISYAWGNPELIDRIWFTEQCYLDLTASASAVLHHLASTETISYLWIDAVCINQADNLEKASQIDIMHQVYPAAKEVLAWVGEEGVDGETALNFMSTLRDQTRLLVK